MDGIGEKEKIRARWERGIRPYRSGGMDRTRWRRGASWCRRGSRTGRGCCNRLGWGGPSGSPARSPPGTRRGCWTTASPTSTSWLSPEEGRISAAARGIGSRLVADPGGCSRLRMWWRFYLSARKEFVFTSQRSCRAQLASEIRARHVASPRLACAVPCGAGAHETRPARRQNLVFFF